MRDRSPVLVTGAPRSGTTWVGQVLCAARGMGYIDEPLNPNGPHGVSAKPWRHWFELIATTDDRYDDEVRAALEFDFRWLEAVRTIRTPRRAARVVVTGAQFALHRALHHRPLFKDPIAFFSAPALADRHGFDVAVLVRHPAAFVASLRRVGWRHDLWHFTNQPALMELLSPQDRQEIHRQLGMTTDDVRHAALLWNVFYGVALDYQRERPNWIFVRHEDLAADPPGGFRRLCTALDIPFDRRLLWQLRRTTRGEAATTSGGPVHQLRRDPRSASRAWRTVLTSSELDRLRELTGTVWPHWYDESSWIT